MTNPLDEFMEYLSGGIAQPHKFKINFNTPRLMNFYPDDISILCTSVTEPGLGYSSNQIRGIGPYTERPYEKNYDPAVATFVVDREMEIKRLFDEWLLLIQPPSGIFNYYQDYVVDIMIDKFDANNELMMTTKLINAYPKSINLIELNSSYSTETMILSVNFTYELYTTEYKIRSS
jgi:hypothetical protein